MVLSVSSPWTAAETVLRMLCLQATSDALASTDDMAIVTSNSIVSLSGSVMGASALADGSDKGTRRRFRLTLYVTTRGHRFSMKSLTSGQTDEFLKNHGTKASSRRSVATCCPRWAPSIRVDLGTLVVHATTPAADRPA
jgi:hypothetical protein